MVYVSCTTARSDTDVESRGATNPRLTTENKRTLAGDLADSYGTTGHQGWIESVLSASVVVYHTECDEAKATSMDSGWDWAALAATDDIYAPTTVFTPHAPDTSQASAPRVEHGAFVYHWCWRGNGTTPLRRQRELAEAQLAAHADSSVVAVGIPIGANATNSTREIVRAVIAASAVCSPALRPDRAVMAVCDSATNKSVRTGAADVAADQQAVRRRRQYLAPLLRCTIEQDAFAAVVDFQDKLTAYEARNVSSFSPRPSFSITEGTATQEAVAVPRAVCDLDGHPLRPRVAYVLTGMVRTLRRAVSAWPITTMRTTRAGERIDAC
jgi:hypothetical protein